TPLAVEKPQNGDSTVTGIFAASGPSFGALPLTCPIARFSTTFPARRRQIWTAGQVPIRYQSRTNSHTASTSARLSPASAGSSSCPTRVTASRSAGTGTSVAAAPPAALVSAALISARVARRPARAAGPARRHPVEAPSSRARAAPRPPRPAHAPNSGPAPRRLSAASATAPPRRRTRWRSGHSRVSTASSRRRGGVVRQFEDRGREIPAIHRCATSRCRTRGRRIRHRRAREFLHRTGSRTAPGGVDSHSGPGRARILRVVGAVVRMAKGRTWNAVRGYEDAVGERDCHSGGTTGGGTAIRCPQSDSNRHCADFKSAASANWAIGAWGSEYPAVRAYWLGARLLRGMGFRRRGLLTAEQGVTAAVGVVDEQADDHPHQEPDPGLDGEVDHQPQAGQHRQDRQEGNPGDAEAARQV